MIPMGKKILDSKALYVILSIIISFSAWLFVTSKDGMKDSAPFRNIPVTFAGTEILEGRGLMIVNDDATASITMQAAPMVLANLSNDPPTLTADVSNITAEGSHTLSLTVGLPTGVSRNDVDVISGLNGNVVTVQVARYLRREVPVQGHFQGKTAQGYLAGDKDDFLFSPATVWVSGQAELVNQVSHALVTINGEELTDTVSDKFSFQLIGASGDPLEGLDVACDVDMVYATFPIRATAEIPLEVKLIQGGGLSESDVRISMSIDSIMVAGSREAVAALAGEGAVTLAIIDLASIRDGDELTFPIALTDELENLSGVTEVKVKVDVRKRVESRTFEVTSHISTIHEPEGWHAEIITQALQVEIRGNRALLDELTEENIRVVADLQDINQAAGQYTVSASIYLDSTGSVSDIGVMNGNYTVVVSLVRDG